MNKKIINFILNIFTIRLRKNYLLFDWLSAFEKKTLSFKGDDGRSTPALALSSPWKIWLKQIDI